MTQLRLGVGNVQKFLTSVVIGSALVLAAGVQSANAASIGFNALKEEASGPLTQIRWVCNPWGRCWWRPNYYVYAPYRVYRPFYRPYYRAWGWRGGYRRW